MKFMELRGHLSALENNINFVLSGFSSSWFPKHQLRTRKSKSKAHLVALAGTPQGLVSSARVAQDEGFREANLC